MSEGLLKKRITEAYSKYYRGESAFGSKITDSIIDSAKKDFGELLHEDDPLYWLHHIGQLQLDFKQKYKKWFGDSS